MQQGARFNLKAVIRQTGLRPDTVRAWERRYGLPTPGRTTGGHRVYSPRDIETIKWLMARQREGLTIQRAVDLWHQIEAQGTDPLQAAVPFASQATTVLAAGGPGETIRRYRENWIQACLAFDEQRAEQIATEAFGVYPLEMVVLELLQQAIAEIGERWYQGEVSVQQEHFCSSLIIRRLEALILANPVPIRPGRILVAGPPGEQHTIGLLVLTMLLRRRGWEVVYLGADVPVERLGMTVRDVKPTLVILAAQQLHTAATLLDAAESIRTQGIALAYGGLIFNVIPELRTRIPGNFLGGGVAQAPEGVEALMIAPHPASPVEAVSEAYRRARDHFSEREGLIESQVVQALIPSGTAAGLLSMVNRRMGLSIDAALALGDIRFLGTVIEWRRGLIRYEQIPDEALRRYLDTYCQVARDQLDERGEPIISWLDTMVNGY